MAADLFCWPCACVFVLFQHMAFVLVFCVPCALMSIVLTPPILLPDYWLICPTCVSLITLICSLFILLVFAVLCQFVVNVNLVVPCPALPCPALPCLALPCLACPALPCQTLLPAVLFFPIRDNFSFCIFLANKSPFSFISPWLPVPLPKPWHNLPYCKCIVTFINAKWDLICYSLEIDWIM